MDDTRSGFKFSAVPVKIEATVLANECGRAPADRPDPDRMIP
jgi:hypothetical protein